MGEALIVRRGGGGGEFVSEIITPTSVKTATVECLKGKSNFIAFACPTLTSNTTSFRMGCAYPAMGEIGGYDFFTDKGNPADTIYPNRDYWTVDFTTGVISSNYNIFSTTMRYLFTAW